MANEISYTVPGDISIMAQPTGMACWATVTTMLKSWKDQVSYTIESCMDTVGPDYRKIYNDDTGLPPDKIEDFAKASEFKIEYQACESPESILRLLESYGPIIVIDDEDSSAAFALHARIVAGIEGSKDPSDTWVKIIDPNNGQVYNESFENFTSKYEAVADVNAVNIQIMHY